MSTYERETLTGRLNLYHALDLRITTYPDWWGLQWSVYLDIQNVYNRSNQQQIRYFVDDRGRAAGTAGERHPDISIAGNEQLVTPCVRRRAPQLVADRPIAFAAGAP